MGGVVVDGPGPDGEEEEEEKVLPKMRTGTVGPLVCRTTGLVTRKHFSLCALSMLEKRKRWPHTSQGYGFSPVWVRRWRFMLGRLVKLFPQISQMNGFSPAQVGGSRDTRGAETGFNSHKDLNYIESCTKSSSFIVKSDGSPPPFLKQSTKALLMTSSTLPRSKVVFGKC